MVDLEFTLNRHSGWFEMNGIFRFKLIKGSENQISSEMTL